MPWAAVFELHGLHVLPILCKKARSWSKCSWHLFTGIGVYIFMVLAECLRLAPRGSKMTSKGLQLSSAGTWPFMVYLEDAGTQTNKKNNWGVVWICAARAWVDAKCWKADLVVVPKRIRDQSCWIAKVGCGELPHPKLSSRYHFSVQTSRVIIIFTTPVPGFQVGSQGRAELVADLRFHHSAGESVHPHSTLEHRQSPIDFQFRL